jgi:hypothetical protein
LLLVALFYVMPRLPVPKTVGPLEAVLFMLALVLVSILLSRLYGIILSRLRRALGLEAWPKPRYNLSLMHLVLAGGLVIVTLLVHQELGLQRRFDLLVLVVGGVTRLAMSYGTRVKRYAVEGIGLLLSWAVLVTMLATSPEMVTFLAIVLVELLTALYGWREWLHVREGQFGV